MKFQFQNPRTSRRMGVLLVTALIMGAALYSLTGLEWTEDITDLLPGNVPAIQAARRVLQDFDTRNTMLIVIGAVDTLVRCDEDKLLRGADSTALRLLASGMFTEVKYRWDIAAALEAGDLVANHLPPLFTATDSSIMVVALRREGLEHRLVDWRETLTITPTPFLTERMRRNPLGLRELTEAKLVSLQALGDNINIHRGYLFTRDRQQVMLLASPSVAMTDSRSAAELVDFMQQVGELLGAESPELQLSYLSGQRFAVNNADQIKRDIRLTVTIATLAIALLSVLVYSRAVLVLLTLLPALFGLNLALGIWRWLPGGLSAIVAGSTAMMLGITVDYAIHYLYHADQSPLLTRSEDPFPALKKLRRPLLLGAGTTAIAFLTLLFSPLPGYRQLGGLVILGVIGSAGFTLYVLPWLLPQHASGKSSRMLLPLTRVMAGCYYWICNHRRSILATIAVLTLLLVPGVLRLQVDGDLQRINAVSDEIEYDLDRVESAFSDYLGSTSVVVFGPDSEEALRKNDAIYFCLQNLQKQEIVSSFSSIADLLPGPATQRENLKRWRAVFSTDRQRDIEAALDAACRTAGVRRDFFAPLWEEGGDDTTMLSTDSYRDSFLDDLLASRLSSSLEQTSVLTIVQLTDMEYFDSFQRALNAAVDGVAVYNGGKFTAALGESIFHEMIRISLLAVILVVVLLTLSLHNTRRIITVLVPLGITVLGTFGIMGWLGMRINLMNCLVVVLIFGLVVDYCLFLSAAISQSHPEDEQSVFRTMSAVLVSALTTLAGMGALALAGHPGLHALGLTALIGIATGLILVMLMIPLLVKKGQNPLSEEV